MRRTSVAVAVLFSLLGGGLISCGQTPTASPHVGPTAQSAPESSSSSLSLTDSSKPEPPTCSADRTRLAVVSTGSTMSQPFADIAVTNAGTASCLLRGYPRIEAWGNAGGTNTNQSVRMGILIHHGIYERVDHGPLPVIVKPHHAAFFSVGTGAAYQGGLHPITIDRLSVALPGTQSAKTLSLNLLATRPVGRRIPVGVTAVRPAQK